MNTKMNSPYRKLLSPIRIGGVLFKNRMFAAPSGLQALSDGSPWPTEEAIAHYEMRAASGAACVCCVGASVVPYDSKPGNTSWDIYNQQAMNRMALLARRIHAHGAKASMELGVAGLVRTGLTVCDGVPTLWNAPGKGMTKEDMEHIKNGFADAAEVCMNCGYEVLLLHFGHAMPVAQFLSPATNKRTDEYGGSFENRCRYPVEIIDAIRARVGRRMVIEVRISGTECEPGGIEIDEAIAFSKMIEDKIDLIHVSAGIHGPKWFTVTHPCGFLPSVPNIYLAEAVKRSGIRIPVAGVGGVSDLAEAEAILEDGKADVLAVARGIIADGGLINKAVENRPDDVRPCVKCMRCHDSVVYERQFHCTVNPEVGIEASLPYLFRKPEKSKKIAVIGGGPAGMAAALEACKMGHKVTLYEKKDHLGGAIVFSDYVPFKYPLHNYKEYLIRQVRKSDIELRLSCAPAPEEIAAQGYDTVLVAIGAEPIRLPVPGLDKPLVMPVTESYGKEEMLPEEIAIIGGGQAGCETALHLARLGKKVAVIEMRGTLAPDASPTHRNELLNAMESEKDLTVLTDARFSQVLDDGVVYVDKEGKDQTLRCEKVLMAVGSRTNYAAVDAYLGTAPEVIPIGDSVRAATVEQATESAYIAVHTLS